MTTLASLVSDAIDSRLLDVHTCFPARVVSYNAAQLVADVQPVIKHSFVARDERIDEDLPQLVRVPVVFPRGGGCSITWPISAGDFVLVHCTESDAIKWFETANTAPSTDIRRHSLASAWCVPGIAPVTSPLPSAVDSGMVLTAPTIKLGGPILTDYVALASKVDAALSAILTWATSHTHLCSAPDTPSDPALPALSITPATGSTKVQSA